MFPKKATTRCDDAKGKYFTMLKIHVVKTDLNIIALAESLALHFGQPHFEFSVAGLSSSGLLLPTTLPVYCNEFRGKVLYV